jgi:bifunctional DNA-binding transcriptional regulator/antitoxin component of YhaV-PrlF toxin-antitoxin module
MNGKGQLMIPKKVRELLGLKVMVNIPASIVNENDMHRIEIAEQKKENLDSIRTKIIEQMKINKTYKKRVFSKKDITSSNIFKNNE